jgi:hypothetical protein
MQRHTQEIIYTCISKREIREKQRINKGHLEKLALTWFLALSTPDAAVDLAGQPRQRLNFSRCPKQILKEERKQSNSIQAHHTTRENAADIRKRAEKPSEQ